MKRKPYRCNHTIYANVLTICDSPLPYGKIIMRANLYSRIANPILDLLVEKGLLERVDDFVNNDTFHSIEPRKYWRCTSLGKTYLEYYTSMENLLQ